MSLSKTEMFTRLSASYLNTRTAAMPVGNETSLSPSQRSVHCRMAGLKAVSPIALKKRALAQFGQ